MSNREVLDANASRYLIVDDSIADGSENPNGDDLEEFHECVLALPDGPRLTRGAIAFP